MIAAAAQVATEFFGLNPMKEVRRPLGIGRDREARASVLQHLDSRADIGGVILPHLRC